MRMEIESTPEVIHYNGNRARVWQGRTEHGLAVVCLVSELTGAFDGPFDDYERYTDASHASPTEAAHALALKIATPHLRVIK